MNEMLENWEDCNTTLYNDGWEALAAYIILQAVQDYRDAVNLEQEWLRKMPDQEIKLPAGLESSQEIEDFFYSRWFAQLTTLDGEMLLNRIKKEMNK